MRRASIEEVGSGTKGFGPKRGLHVCLEEKCTHDIVDCANSTFGLAICGSSVWAGEAKKNAIT